MYDTISHWLSISEEDEPSECQIQFDTWQDELEAADEVEEAIEHEGLSEEGVDVIKKM